MAHKDDAEAGGELIEEFFIVESPCRKVAFRLSEIVAIETPNWPSKPCGWLDDCAAAVYLRNRSDCITITDEQWKQLRVKLGWRF